MPLPTLRAAVEVQRPGLAHPRVLDAYGQLRSAVAGRGGTAQERMVALHGLSRIGRWPAGCGPAAI